MAYNRGWARAGGWHASELNDCQLAASFKVTNELLTPSPTTLIPFVWIPRPSLKRSSRYTFSENNLVCFQKRMRFQKVRSAEAYCYLLGFAILYPFPDLHCHY
jgi:hypothetical protein